MRLLKQLKIKNMVIKCLAARLRSLKCSSRNVIHLMQIAVDRDNDHETNNKRYIIERMEDELSTDTDGSTAS